MLAGSLSQQRSFHWRARLPLRTLLEISPILHSSPITSIAPNGSVFPSNDPLGMDLPWDGAVPARELLFPDRQAAAFASTARNVASFSVGIWIGSLWPKLALHSA